MFARLLGLFGGASNETGRESRPVSASRAGGSGSGTSAATTTSLGKRRRTGEEAALEEAAEVVDHYRRLLVERPPTDKARPAEVIEEEGRRLRASERYPRARGDTRVRYLLLRAHLRTIDFRPFFGAIHQTGSKKFSRNTMTEVGR